MPTYEYACTACSHNLEVVQSFTDDPLTECPECKGRLRKVFGNVGVTFKGSGFYKTDSRGNGSGKSSKTSDSSSSTSSSDTSSTSSSDSSSSSSSGSTPASGGASSSSTTKAS